MTVTLAEFLAARLGEDEYLAGRFRFTGQDNWDAEMLGRLWWYGPADAPKDRSADDPIIQHVARHDPARVLRQVAAMRAILAAYESASATVAEHCFTESTPYHVNMTTLEWCVRDLAAIWSDHPDYQQEWKPAV